MYVCGEHLAVAGSELQLAMELLTDQLQLGILDSTVSVSGTEDGGQDGA